MILKAYWNADDAFLVYDLVWKGHSIRPGDPIKIKRRGSNFRFIRIVRLGNEEWLECMDTQSGKCRKFDMSQFDGPVVKRSQRKAA